MKYAMLVADGMADRPVKELDNKTPLEVARIPNMNYIAEQGKTGYAVTVPEGFSPASDVANMALLGYDPRKYYTGRGPLEAANMGVKLGDDDVAFRCNTVTIADEKMADYSAGHITNKEAHTIIEFLDKQLGSEAMRFYPGVSYRHLCVINSARAGIKKEDLLKTVCTPPHDILDKHISRHMPHGPAVNFLKDIMAKSRELLASHEINKVRVDLKENPANMVWLWGQGKKPELPLFYDKFKVNGSIISAVDLLKGLGRVIGLDVINVPGATGYYDTNYLGKAEYAVESLKKHDFVFVHVEAPDEAGHNGDVRAKLTAIENFDRLVVGTVLEGLKKSGKDFRIAILPDHATPISIRTHARDPIPFALCGAGIEKDNITVYNETAIRKSSLYMEEGFKIIELLLK